MDKIELEYNSYLITTDKDKLQPHAIHKWLSEESYWAKYVPFNVVKSSFDNSYTIGVLKDGNQVAYARLVTDYTTFAYLADVYVLEGHRGKGLSKIMVQALMGIDWVKGLRRVMLATLDAKELYRKYGFTEPRYPERIMEITRPNIYGDEQSPVK